MIGIAFGAESASEQGNDDERLHGNFETGSDQQLHLVHTLLCWSLALWRETKRKTAHAGILAAQSEYKQVVRSVEESQLQSLERSL